MSEIYKDNERVDEREAEKNSILDDYLKDVGPISKFINEGFEEIDRDLGVQDGVLGFAVGDALGVPVEFSRRETLIDRPVVDMMEYGVHNQPKGTWSDDTSMMIATMDAIINSSKIDYHKIADNFCLWASSRKFNPHGKLFDIGITTSDALKRYMFEGCEPTKAGNKGYYDNGNGSLMRILPLAYYFNSNKMSDEEMATIINNVSSITHAHPISCMGCYLYVKYAMDLLDGKDFNEAYQDLLRCDVSMYDNDTVKAYGRILSGELGQIKDQNKIKSSGFVVDSLEASIWCCLNSDNYKVATLKAVNLGDDTDTVGGLTGGLAGIKYGRESIPKNWVDSLAQKDYLVELCDEYQKTIKKTANLNKIRHV